jgi:NAD(P)-dependent dehydrogenase (short-subunit alcohol dehydrogenase family)
MPTVLVLGASRGIGAAAVHRLAGANWDVLAGVRRAEDADPLRAAHPLRVTPVTLDITKPDDIASKFALEGIADALRMEVSPWGVRVVLVEPAQTDTDLWRNADQDADALESTLSPGHRALYARHIAGFRKSIPRSQRTAVPADEVAGVIERALTDRRPRARYVVGRGPRLQVLTSRLLPTALMDALLRSATGVPRRA